MNRALFIKVQNVQGSFHKGTECVGLFSYSCGMYRAPFIRYRLYRALFIKVQNVQGSFDKDIECIGLFLQNVWFLFYRGTECIGIFLQRFRMYRAPFIRYRALFIMVWNMQGSFYNGVKCMRLLLSVYIYIYIYISVHRDEVLFEGLHIYI